MEKFIILEYCDDGTCCCLSPRSSVVFISCVSLTSTLIDMFLGDAGTDCCPARQHVDLLRSTLVTLFQKANILLLLGAIVESALLVQIYLWYSLGYIVLGFVVSIIEFLFRFKQDGAWNFIYFVTEVALLFVTFRCLPLVDLYRKRIEVTETINSK